MTHKDERTSAYPIHPLILHRWSPRAMSGEEIDDRDLMTLFEAAHWAPSSANNQPWRFLYAKRETELFPLFLHLLVEYNQVWAKNAAALLVILSKTTFDSNGKPSRTHSFDTGAAWMGLALQGSQMGLVVHGMEGFDYERTRKELKVPDGYQVEAMVAIGKRGSKEALPPKLQEREKPSLRKSLQEIAKEGFFF